MARGCSPSPRVLRRVFRSAAPKEDAPIEASDPATPSLISAGTGETSRARPRRFTYPLYLSVVLLVFLSVPSSVSATGTTADTRVPTAAEQLASARAQLDASEARLVSLEQERLTIETEHQSLSDTQRSLARNLELALHDTEQFAVEAYVAGGPNASVGEILGAHDVGDAMWRSEVLAGQTTHGIERATALRDLTTRADAAVRQIALRSDQNRRKVAAATLDRFFASVANKRAEQLVAAQQRSGSALATDGADAVTITDGWARLRNCESSGNYQAVSASGLYRGAYQFDVRTWQSVGGSGDPADAPPAEQDMRAETLYRSRGRSPWPVCGRYLP